MKRVHATVRGRVQGVGFRAEAATVARRLGLVGWVRNRLEGTVETVAEGPEAQVQAYLAWLGQGPSLSHVSGVDVEWVPATGDTLSFDVR